MLKNQTGQKIRIFVYDLENDCGKTGDAANITAYLSKDNAAAVQTDDVHPAEVDSTNMPGIYEFDMTQAESNCYEYLLYAKTTTANMQIDIVKGQTIYDSAQANALKMLVNKTVQNKLTGVITIYDDDAVTPVLLLTPSDDGTNITLTPSIPE
jgi:hypothetical protein